MTNEIVLDIETQNSFQEVTRHDLRLLKISVVGIYEYAADRYQVFRESALNNLWPILEKADRLIGYNINKFDLPILNHYYPGDIFRLPTLDMMEIVKNTYGRSPKLDDLARATFNRPKSGDGLKAIAYFKDGRWDELEKYCLDDVKITKELYEYGKKFRIVKCLSHFNTPEDIAVDFAPKEEKKQINLSLPF